MCFTVPTAGRECGNKINMKKPRAPRRMWRTEQRAHKFKDRKKEENKKKARKKVEPYDPS